MTEADRLLLVSALTKAPTELATQRLADGIEAAVPSLSGRGSEVIEALVSLIALGDDDDSILDELSRDVANSEDVELSDQARDQFAEQLLQMLGLESLTLAAHAYDVVGEHERGFHDARILTDIRPVFGRVASEGAHAASIVASLKIDFHTTAGPIESCFFALDPSDLLRLRRVVDRALEKTKSLKDLIARVNLPYWEYRGTEEEPDATSS